MCKLLGILLSDFGYKEKERCRGVPYLMRLIVIAGNIGNIYFKNFANGISWSTNKYKGLYHFIGRAASVAIICSVI